MFTLRILITVIGLGLLLAVAGGAAPRLEVDNPTFDFGYVPQHASISHVFWLRSTGEDTVTITRVIPGCGCTKAPLASNVLAPGDSTQLEVIFSTRSYSSRVHKSPRIETNESSDPRRLNIISNVVKQPDSTYPIVIRPYKLDISQFGDKRRDKVEFFIMNVSTDDLALKLVDQPAGLFEVKLPGKVKAGETAKAEIKLLEEVVGETFEKSITLQLDDKTASRFTIPIKRTLRTTASAPR